MSHGRASEDGEEGLGKNRADRQEKNRDDEFYPAGRDHPGLGDAMATSDGRGDFDRTTAPARSWMKSGTLTVLPVSRTAGFVTLDAVSPRRPSGASVIFSWTEEGSSTCTALPSAYKTWTGKFSTR